MNSLDDHYMNVVENVMFVHGDDEVVLDSCKLFVFNLVKYQLLKMANDSLTFHKRRSKKQEKMDLTTLLFVCRRNRLLLGRLLRMSKLLDTISAQSCYAEDAEEYAVPNDTDDDEPDDDGDKVATKGRHPIYGAIYDAINELGLEYTSDDLERDVDKEYFVRQKTMADRVSSFDSDLHERFTDARKTSFVQMARKRSVRDFAFQEWLETTFDRNVEFVLRFFAKETVVLIVEDACRVRRRERKGTFLNEGTANCLQMRHYEEALRSNLGYRYNQDFLFGYF